MGNPSAKNPCLVRNQKDRSAPAAKKRELSVPVSALCSQLSAETCSFGAQSQSWPFCAQTPCPYCVIFPAIQRASGNAAITSHTSCVFPMLRVGPPTTSTRQNLFGCIIRGSGTRLSIQNHLVASQIRCRQSSLATRHFFRHKNHPLANPGSYRRA